MAKVKLRGVYMNMYKLEVVKWVLWHISNVNIVEIGRNTTKEIN